MAPESMQTHLLWDSAPGQQLEGHELHIGRGRSNWKWGECWANLQKPGSSTVPSPSPAPTQSHKVVKQVAPPWHLPKALPHTIYSCFLQ